MLKYLANPEHYCTTKDYYNNIVTNFVKISEYARYKCKKEGKLYPCNLIEINMFKSYYITTFDGDLTIIDFSDFNNNDEHVPIKNNCPEYIQNLYIKIQNLYRIYTILQKKILRKFIIKTKIYRKHI